MNHDSIREALTFDDVLLVPQESRCLPSQVDLKTDLCRGLQLNIPLISAAMDTVTESKMAIRCAQEGGVGVIHRNLSPLEQASEVKTVKKFESGMVVNPITIGSKDTLRQARELMDAYNISGLPVVEEGRCVGIITNRDLRFVENLEATVSSRMTREIITIEEGGSPELSK
jgi:IMP dehydrogenase